MWRKSVNECRGVVIFVRKCRLTSQSEIALGNEMKRLNEKKQFEKVLNLFDIYRQDHAKVFSSMIITQALKASTQIEDLQRGIAIDQFVSSSKHNDSYISASLIHLYMQCGEISRAQSLFESAPKRTLSMHGAMMKGFIKNEMADRAIDLFKQMKQHDEVILILLFNACARLKTEVALNLVKQVASSIPKSFYSNPRLLPSLIDALMKCGDVRHARSLFDRSTRKVLPLYGTIMKGYVENDQAIKAIEFFEETKRNGLLQTQPNQTNRDQIKSIHIIHLCVINGLSQLGMASIAESISQDFPTSLLDNVFIQNALIDMWGKVGCFNKAKDVFDRISRPDCFGYTSMINSYGLNGMGSEAIELFDRMPGDLINDRTHVCVLNACSHSGLLNQARQIFANAPKKTEMIYTTMVDCCSRAAAFDEAQELLQRYEIEHSPSLSMHMALLSGARNEKNVHLSKRIVSRMREEFPLFVTSLTSASILLANVFASSGDQENASRIQNELSQSDQKKKVGLSWTTINGKIHEFRAHDRWHPQSAEIYDEIHRISLELVQHGHRYDPSWITRPIQTNETIASVLCGHSEKLAIAFNFVVNPLTKRIEVTKNLRVCGDCHEATKLIAKIRQCQITVRDANRIHHFSPDGHCSCGDYF